MKRTGNGAEFDVKAFLDRLEAARDRAGMSWRQVALEAHVSASIFTQLRYGHHPDAVSLGRLLTWLNTGDEPWWMTTVP